MSRDGARRALFAIEHALAADDIAEARVAAAQAIVQRALGRSVCADCGASFQWPGLLAEHERTAHDDVEAEA